MKRLLARVFLFGLPLSAIYFGFFASVNSKPPHPGKVAVDVVQVSERLPIVKLERLPPIDEEASKYPLGRDTHLLELARGSETEPLVISVIEDEAFLNDNDSTAGIVEADALPLAALAHANDESDFPVNSSSATPLLDLSTTDLSTRSGAVTSKEIEVGEPENRSEPTTALDSGADDIAAPSESVLNLGSEPNSVPSDVPKSDVPNKVGDFASESEEIAEIEPLEEAPETDAPGWASENGNLNPPSWSPVDLRNVAVNSVDMDATPATGLPMGPRGQQQSLEALKLGFELVQRGAPYSARARFVEALRIVAGSLDAKNATNEHSIALAHALNAYQEAGDFFPTSSHPDEAVRIEFVVGGHDTAVLQTSNVNLRQLTPEQCVREYVAYAEQEFGKALGHEENGSQALYGLGRLEWAETTTPTHSKHVRTFRAMSLYQAAMTVNPENYAAANELGVLLAKNGNYRDAIAALNHSIQYSQQPTAFRNLASLYRRTGQIEQAGQAEYLAMRSASNVETPYAVTKPRVEWVEPHEFAGVAVGQPHLQVARNTATAPRPISNTPNPSMTIQNEKKPIRTSARPNLRRWPFGRSVSR